MTVIQRHQTDRTLDRLPVLPPDVRVPDDIRGLDTPTKRPAQGVRWMRWLAAIVLLGGAGVLTAALLRGDDTVQAPVDYMEVYGTDNPTFIDATAGPGTVEIVPAVDFMRLYGTDNPVIATPAETADTVNTGEYMTLYGTDNPVFAPAPTLMELYGTDNPVVVERVQARPAVDSPGGTSLTIPTRDQDRPVFDSPGGNSLIIQPQG